MNLHLYLYISRLYIFIHRTSAEETKDFKALLRNNNNQQLNMLLNSPQYDEHGNKLSKFQIYLNLQKKQYSPSPAQPGQRQPLTHQGVGDRSSGQHGDVVPPPPPEGYELGDVSASYGVVTMAQIQQAQHQPQQQQQYQAGGGGGRTSVRQVFSSHSEEEGQLGGEVSNTLLAR